MAALPIWRLSGGGANTSPAASLGGIMSTTTLAGGDLFDDISDAETSSGDIEYRGIYLLNNGSSDLTSTVVWIQSNTPDADTDIAIALSIQGLNATMASIANESTPPAGPPTFSSPPSVAAGLVLGTLAAGQRFGLWVRRTVVAGAAPYNGDTFQLRVSGSTGA